MGFQRMGGDGGAIAPYLVQQGLARHGAPGAMQEFQDIGFLLGQADLARRRSRSLAPGWKQIGPDLKGAVFAGAMRPRCAESRASSADRRNGLSRCS